VSDRFSVVPAAYVLLRRQNEVLLQLRRNTGYRDGHWAAAAAGHVEAGEPVLAAARREAAEELGVEIAPADLVPLTAMHRTHGNGRPIDERVDFFFECRRWAGQPRRLEAAKSADLRWFALDALPEPVVPHERFVLDALRGGTLPPIVTFGFAGLPGDARGGVSDPR
jgi:8-oxo-dGTP diphosphatase